MPDPPSTVIELLNVDEAARRLGLTGKELKRRLAWGDVRVGNLVVRASEGSRAPTGSSPGPATDRPDSKAAATRDDAEE